MFLYDEYYFLIEHFWQIAVYHRADSLWGLAFIVCQGTGGISNRSSSIRGSSNHLRSYSDRCCRMRSMTRSSNYCVESIMVIGCVGYSPDGTVRFHQGVRSFDNVTVSYFTLSLLVSCVAICYTIFEFVFGISL